MNWHSFIFSNDKWLRLSRHLLFWSLWWMYFSLSYFHYSQTGLENVSFEPWNFQFFVRTVLLLFLHILACYYFIGELIPRYLLPSRYASFIIHILILCVFILFASYFLHRWVFPLLSQPSRNGENHLWWTSITAGLLSAPKIISAAAAWTLAKRWWLKQKEKEKLEQEKLVADLQLLKAQIHPRFLFSTLDNISMLTENKDVAHASTVLLKLADILSYMLYDSDKMLAPLDREISIIKDYLAIQKIRMGEKLEMDIAVKGDTQHRMIAPLLLFSFVENMFIAMDKEEGPNCWINLEFHIERTGCTMKMIYGLAERKEGAGLEDVFASLSETALRRLDHLYPGSYELKTTVESEILMTNLKIAIIEVPQNDTSNNYPEIMTYATA